MESLVMYAIGLGALVLAGLSPAAADPGSSSRGARSPIIATGWDSPAPRQFREGLATFEGWGVFDGTTRTRSSSSAGIASSSRRNPMPKCLGTCVTPL